MKVKFCPSPEAIRLALARAHSVHLHARVRSSYKDTQLASCPLYEAKVLGCEVNQSTMSGGKFGHMKRGRELEKQPTSAWSRLDLGRNLRIETPS